MHKKNLKSDTHHNERFEIDISETINKQCDILPSVLEARPANLSRRLADIRGSSADLVHVGLPGYKSWPVCSLGRSLPTADIRRDLVFFSHLQHLHSTHGTHPRTACIADIADFNTPLFICHLVDLSFEKCKAHTSCVPFLLFASSVLVCDSK